MNIISAIITRGPNSSWFSRPTQPTAKPTYVRQQRSVTVLSRDDVKRLRENNYEEIIRKARPNSYYEIPIQDK